MLKKYETKGRKGESDNTRISFLGTVGGSLYQNYTREGKKIGEKKWWGEGEGKKKRKDEVISTKTLLTRGLRKLYPFGGRRKK